MTVIQQTHLASSFVCLGDRCEDTCCKHWSMQVDAPTLDRYTHEAPELLAAVEQEQGAGEARWIMRKYPQTSYCVKLEGGLCGIHKAYGSRMLGDACHFYPRVTRALGDAIAMTVVPSCPEVVRLAFFSESNPFLFSEQLVERLPTALKDYLPEGIKSEDALNVHRAFLEAAGDQGADIERVFSRIVSASHSLERIGRDGWAHAAPMYLRLADGRLLPPETDIADPFNLLHALSGLIAASQKKMPPRLAETVAEMEQALAVSLDWQQVQIVTRDESLPAYQCVQALWQDRGGAYDNMLKRYLQMQLSLALYPFAGLGENLPERIAIIGVRLATVRLALMCANAVHGAAMSQDIVVRVVQSLSRFLDHLADPAFSLQIYKETGWIKESRLRGLLFL